MIPPHQIATIRELTAKFQPTQLGVFGSYARGEATQESDLDILIEFGQKVNFLELVELEQSLSDALGIKVDLVTLRSVNPRLKPYILKDLVML